jgi:hypothetical protein
MAQQKIQLRKIRDFGDVFSDSFQFIRQEFKPLLTAFVLIGGPFILVNSILLSVFANQSVSFFQQVIRGAFNMQMNMSDLWTPAYFITLVSTVLNVSALKTVVAVYMDLYDKDNRSHDTKEVWLKFLKCVAKIFFFTLIRYLIIMVAAIVMFVPVLGVLAWIAFCIFFIVATTPYTFIMVSEEESFFNSFTRCFEITKGYFWISFAIYLVASLIFIIGSGIVGFLGTMMIDLSSYFSIKDITAVATIFLSVIHTIQYFFYLILFVCVGLQYYDLIEIREGTGLMKRLQNLGRNVNPNAEIEEQY